MLTTCRGEPGVFLGLTPAGLSVTGCTGRPAAKRLHFMRSEITIEMSIGSDEKKGGGADSITIFGDLKIWV